VLRFSEVSRGRPEAAWALVSEPARWSSWAPHIRGAIGLGSPEVQRGRRGVVLVAFIAPVPVRVSDKSEGRFWDWRTGPLWIRHQVESDGEGGSVLSIEVRAPAPLEALVGLTYGPLIRWVLHRLSVLAAASS
jgi:hypothetical protein